MDTESFAARRDRLLKTGFRAPLDHVCADLIPGHVVRFRECSLDAYAIRLQYEVTPPLPRREAGEPPSVWWVTSAEDSLGNQYTDAGGAFGLSRDGQKTEGELSLNPLPAAPAIVLRVRVEAWLRPSIGGPLEEHRCWLDVGPLPAA